MNENEKRDIPEVKDWDGAANFVAKIVEQNKSLTSEALEKNETLASEAIAHSLKHARRWFIAFLVTLAALFATNAIWLYVFQSYDFVSQDGEGVNSINTGNQEDINYGTEGKAEKE